jgi:hypothetical protein
MSLDRPFGIYLHNYFDAAYQAVVGKPASSFRYIQGQTPLSENSTGTCQREDFFSCSGFEMTDFE